MTVGSAGNAHALALYARMAALTGSVARGFLAIQTATPSSPSASARTASAPAATATSASTAAVVAATTAAAASAAPAPVAGPVASGARLSGVGLRLGTVPAGPGVFDSLRSAVLGLQAQTGFDQLIVRRLIGSD